MIGSHAVSTGKRKFSAREDRLLQAITTRYFPSGYTILDAKGGWFDAARGKFVREESRQILICAAAFSTVRAWARHLGAALRQKELLIIEVGRAVSVKVKIAAGRARR